MAEARITRDPTYQVNPPGIALDEYLALGSDQNAEVVDGELIMMSPQKLQNSEIAHALIFSIETFIRGKNLGKVFTELTYAPDIDDRKRRIRGSLVPDVLFISNDRYQQQVTTYGRKDFLRVAPEFVVEVVSPDDKYSLITRKAALYLQYGTQLVWVIDPQQGNARVITPGQPAGQIMGADTTLPGEPVLPGWSIRLKELLSGDQ